MRKIKVGDVVVAKKRVGEVRQLFVSKGVGLAFVYFPYVHETDSMILSGYEQNQHMSDLRVATASEKKDFRRRKKELKSGGDMSRRRFELIDPSRNKNKFWEVEVDGSEVTTFWGRIGQAASQKTKDFGSAERAEAAAEKLVKEKEKKGYELASGARVHGKKASGKKSGRKSKCAHCGEPSGSPTECAEPWEHSYYAGGCDCKFCDAHFNKKLTSSEINWLAKHGWSSTQIKAMKPAEARLLIEAGKHKKPGVETEAAGGMSRADEQYRDNLLKFGIGFRAKSGVLEKACAIAEKTLSETTVTKYAFRDRGKLSKIDFKAYFGCGLSVLRLGAFRTDDDDLLVVPADKSALDALLLVIQDVSKSSRGKFKVDVEALGNEVREAAVKRFGAKWRAHLPKGGSTR